MKYQISEFDLADAKTLEKLAEAGIEDSDQLLDQAASNTQRKTLAEESGIPEDVILQLASVSDFVRVKGVGVKLARLMVAVPDMVSVQTLAGADPTTLRKKLQQADTEIGIRHRVPSVRVLSECIEEASELRPRVFVDRPFASDFMSEVRRLDEQELAVCRREMVITGCRC